MEEFTLRPSGYELACKGLMLDVLVQLLRTHPSQALTETSPHDAKLIELMSQIERTPAKDWSNKVIAEHLMLSPDHTAKLFKRFAGCRQVNLCNPFATAKRAGFSGNPISRSKRLAKGSDTRIFIILAESSADWRGLPLPITASSQEFCKVCRPWSAPACVLSQRSIRSSASLN